MLHVAAQGDQPVSLSYFIEKGLNINSKDARNSTPLHWASFSGAELTMSYIVAWGGDLEAKDTKGLTPLHLAVKSYREFHSMKGIKQLLIKGADRDALDN
jgi:ankyrin repeat protein